MEIKETWTEFKNTINAKSLQMQYKEYDASYLLWVQEGNITYLSEINKDGGADQLDFEANYKATANKPLYVGEDVVFSNVEIRDIVDHFSTVIDGRNFIPKTIYIENNLNQDLKICIGGSRHSDFSTGVPACGGEQTVTTLTTDYLTLSDYFPYFMIRIHCEVAPTTGSVNVWILKVKP